MGDIQLTFLLFQLLNLALMVGWIVLAVRALRQLNQAKLPETLKFLWAFLIVTVPVLGAIAFLTVRPTQTKVTA
jgi:uncharacterized membrane protein YhaH (DUF805 family)